MISWDFRVIYIYIYKQILWNFEVRSRISEISNVNPERKHVVEDVWQWTLWDHVSNGNGQTGGVS